MAAGLNEEMRQLIRTGKCMVATASKEGWPNVGPKGSVMVLDDLTLAYGESVGQQTYRNLLENPRVAVAIVDHERFAGYRFVGIAQVETAGPLHEKFVEFFAKMKLPGLIAAVRINLEACYSLSARSAGQRLW